MAKTFEKASISHGQIYKAGDEIPDHVGKTKSKLRRDVRTQPAPTNQGDRPGMSGSGEAQKGDIVDGETGVLTTRESDEAKKSHGTKSDDKSKK